MDPLFEVNDKLINAYFNAPTILIRNLRCMTSNGGYRITYPPLRAVNLNLRGKNVS